jgi:hypothetical protein
VEATGLVQVVEALKEWHDFYVLVGTAGATLLALLFVAVSLGVGFLTEERQSATHTFMSPVVVHFTSVFFLSAVALFPWHQARFFAALIGVTALIGAILSTYITVQVVRTDMTNYVEDYLAYGLLPGLGYLALLAVAVSIYLEKDFGLDRPLAHYDPPAPPSGLAERKPRALPRWVKLGRTQQECFPFRSRTRTLLNAIGMYQTCQRPSRRCCRS